MNAQGFGIYESIFSSDECRDILESVESKVPRAGVRGLMSNDSIASLANDRRLISLALQLTGKTLLPFKATLFSKTAKANWLVAWHQDTTLPIERFHPSAGWSAPSIKAGILYAQAPASSLERVLALRIHLDASTKTNGPLRVIPGSHRHGILDDEKVREFVETVRPVECLVGRGGLLAMSPLLLHASSKIDSDEPRRVVHIEYAESLDIGGGVRLTIS